jgi:hypothetical protein
LFRETSKSNRDVGSGIDRSEFAYGFVLYSVALNLHLSEDDHFNLARQGTVRLSLIFATALPDIVTVVACADREIMIEIELQR